MPVTNNDSGPRRNATAAAMSLGVPTRPVADAAMLARMNSPAGPRSSACPIDVEMAPGLTALMRARRFPHCPDAATTRTTFARFAMAYAMPGSLKAAG